MNSGAPGLYIHVPFCSAVCPYCDFAVRRDRPDEHGLFIDHLLAEAEVAPDFAEPFDTLYLGGGTPSALSAQELRRLIDGLDQRLPMARDRRILCEANPEDVSGDRIKSWVDLGISFLSMGIQSFRDEELSFLGRRHDSAMAKTALIMALESPLSTVSCDLIFGLPHQGRAELTESLSVLKDLEPDHASAYQLTIKPGTPFSRRREIGRLVELGDEGQEDLFLFLHEAMSAAGLDAYEVSNFARTPDSQSAHNRKYWDHIPYLGLGPSAHSFDGRKRWWNRPQLKDWISALDQGQRPLGGEETLSLDDLALETLMLRLRKRALFDLSEYKKVFGRDLLVEKWAEIDELVESGRLIRHEMGIEPTISGLAIADAMARTLSI